MIAVMALQVIAATANKLAYDLENGRLWEGELAAGVADMQRQLDDVSRHNRGG